MCRRTSASPQIANTAFASSDRRSRTCSRSVEKRTLILAAPGRHGPADPWCAEPRIRTPTSRTRSPGQRGTPGARRRNVYSLRTSSRRPHPIAVALQPQSVGVLEPLHPSRLLLRLLRRPRADPLSQRDDLAEVIRVVHRQTAQLLAHRQPWLHLYRESARLL